MKSLLTGKEIADVILIGERHDKATAKNYVIENLATWRTHGYNNLGVELGADEPVGDMFTMDLPEAEQLPPNSSLQAALDLARTKPKVREAIEVEIHQMTVSKEASFGRMVSQALESGFAVHALETAEGAKVKLAQREAVMDPVAAQRIANSGPGWIAVVGKDHTAGMKGILESSGLTVQVEIKT